MMMWECQWQTYIAIGKPSSETPHSGGRYLSIKSPSHKDHAAERQWGRQKVGEEAHALDIDL